MNILDIIKQLKDQSPQIKLKALKELESSGDFSEYPVDTLLELNEVLSEHREYFNPSVQMYSLRLYEKVSALLTDKMKESPETIAREAAMALIDDDDEDEAVPVSKTGNNTVLRKTKTDLPPRKSYVPPDEDEDVSVDFSVVEKKEFPKETHSEKPESSDYAEIETVEKPVRKKPPVSKKTKSSVRPKMLIVYSEDETKLAKFWNISLAILLFIVTLAVSYKEILSQSNTGYGVLGFAILFVILLFTPNRIFPSYNKIRLSIFGFAAITSYIFYTNGFSYDYGLIDYVPAEFQLEDFFKDMNLNISKFILLFWLILPTYMVITDTAPVTGTKMFIMLFFIYSSVSLLESFITHSTIETLLQERGIFKIINPPYLRPFYFGVNIFYPMVLVVSCFAFLQELFSLSFKRMIACLLIALTVLAPMSCLLVNMRTSPYPNIADFFWPRTLEKYKENLATGIYNSINAVSSERSVEKRVFDKLAVIKGKFIDTNNKGTNETVLEPEILIPENAYDPDLSASGLYMAFVQKDNNKSDIKFMRLQTREVISLVSDNANNRYPVFSRDASKIAFISDADGQDNVFMIGTNGRKLRQITMTTGKKKNLNWVNNFLVYESDGRIIKYPVPQESSGSKTDLKERIKLYSKIASEIMGVEVVANKSSLEGESITINFKTFENNEANIFRQIYSSLIIASKVFKEHSTKIKTYRVKAKYLTTEILVVTSPEIVRFHLENREYLTDEKINIWLKTSTILLNGKPYLTGEGEE